ncbi:MAG: glycosyltransferase family protein [Exilibacterium sp.]
MIVAILQARMSSTRLPGKVLKPLLGQPMLGRQLERIQSSHLIDRLVVATSTDPSDDAIERFCRRSVQMKNFTLYRGSLDDVLDRYYQAAKLQAAKLYPATHIVRLTGDCPLADAEVIDAVIVKHLDSGADYTSNCRPPTLPDGLDVEVISAAALSRVWQCAQLPSEREHVTRYIVTHPQDFNIALYRHRKDYSHIRLTVDCPEDFQLVKKIYAELYQKNPTFKLQDVLDLLEKHRDWLRINAHLQRNAGIGSALQKDLAEGLGAQGDTNDATSGSESHGAE